MIPSKISIIIDTREKQPLFTEGDRDFDIITRKLDTGDYSISGFENLVIIERKQDINELYACFTSQRKRFFNEIDRMMQYPLRFLVIGSHYTELFNPLSYKVKGWRSRSEIEVKKSAVAITSASVDSLRIKNNIHVIFAGNKINQVVRNLIKRIVACKEELRAKYERTT